MDWCRVTNQARAAVAAAAAASKYTHPEQPLQPQQLSYSKPSSLDVLSESAASQVSRMLGLYMWACSSSRPCGVCSQRFVRWRTPLHRCKLRLCMYVRTCAKENSHWSVAHSL